MKNCLKMQLCFAQCGPCSEERGIWCCEDGWLAGWILNGDSVTPTSDSEVHTAAMLVRN